MYFLPHIYKKKKKAIINLVLIELFYSYHLINSMCINDNENRSMCEMVDQDI